jgi:hypothetical protein
MLRISTALLALLAAPQALAMPVEIEISARSAFRGAVDSESWSQPGIEGTLLAELQPDGTLSDIYGEIRFATDAIPLDLQGAGFDGTTRVVAGHIDLRGDGDPGSISSFLELENGVRFSFADRVLSSGANSFADGTLLLSGISWDPLAGQTGDSVNVPIGIELAAKIRGGSAAPIPEPASLGLIAAGGLVVAAALRRPLPR